MRQSQERWLNFAALLCDLSCLTSLVVGEAVKQLAQVLLLLALGLLHGLELDQHAVNLGHDVADHPLHPLHALRQPATISSNIFQLM